MEDGSMMSSRVIASRLLISKNYVRNTLKGQIQNTEHQSLIFLQISAYPRLSYRELTKTFNENHKKCVSSNIVKDFT